MIQVHFVDWIHHMLEGALDPRHPDYRQDEAEKYAAILLDVYRMADDIVAEIRQALPEGSDVAILGDHGQDLHHTTLHTNEWLAGEGLLSWQGDGIDVDWSRTQVYAAGNYLYLNVEGREPTGIVAPGDVYDLEQRLIDGLLGLEDPERKSRAILLAGRKQDFAPMGANGLGAGDVIFICRSGYQARNNRGAVFTPTRLFKEFTSGHDHFWPFDPKIQTRLYASGPSFKEGYRHSRPESSKTSLLRCALRWVSVLPAVRRSAARFAAALGRGADRSGRHAADRRATQRSGTKRSDTFLSRKLVPS